MHALQPNFFQFPNVIADELMRALTANEFLCLVVIIRKTRGWHRQSDSISLSQFQEMTGIKSKTTILRALRVLENPDVGLIRSTKVRLRPTTYELGEIFYTKKCNSETISKIVTALGGRNTILDLNPVPNIEHTKDSINKKRKGKARSGAQVKPKPKEQAPPSPAPETVPSDVGRQVTVHKASDGLTPQVSAYLDMAMKAIKK